MKALAGANSANKLRGEQHPSVSGLVRYAKDFDPQMLCCKLAHAGYSRVSARTVRHAKKFAALHAATMARLAAQNLCRLCMRPLTNSDLHRPHRLSLWTREVFIEQ